jgi:hypothetical protein
LPVPIQRKRTILNELSLQAPTKYELVRESSLSIP